MKKLGMLFTLLLSASVFTGCYAGLGVQPVPGVLYASVKGPVHATSNQQSTKSGTATCSSILGLIATGDCSIEAAARAGGIKTIHHIDHETTNLIGIYATYTTRVHGN